MNQTGVTRLGMEVECETLTISDVLGESTNGRSGRHMDLDPGKGCKRLVGQKNYLQTRKDLYNFIIFPTQMLLKLFKK